MYAIGGGKKKACIGRSFLHLPERTIPLLGEHLTKFNAQVTLSPEEGDAKGHLGQASTLQTVL